MQDVASSIEMLNEICKIGVAISLDDFGTGHSSLGYLKKMPVSVLKIDESFVRGITSDKDDMAIVNAILAMSKALNILVVAEGVESEEQLQILSNAGCSKIQGYLIGHPVPPVEFIKYLNNNKFEYRSSLLSQCDIAS